MIQQFLCVIIDLFIQFVMDAVLVHVDWIIIWIYIPILNVL